MKQEIKQASILVSLLVLLSGCLPIAFSAATDTTFKAARDGTISSAVDDITIAAKIQKEFISSGFRELYTKISVEVIKGRVLYTGRVQTEEDIIKAVEIAWAQNGVVEVINELTVDENSGTFNSVQYVKDTWITSQIKAKSIMHRAIKFVNYTVVTSSSIVYIFGIGRSEEEMEEISRIAAETAGVEKVVNYVKLKESTE
ncbi:MAG: BON domain-containing protein [Pseudomonadota bacterium]